MSFGELLFLAMLALLVFGPRKLPEVARTLARIMTDLRRASNEFRYSLEDEIRNLDIQEVAQKRLGADAAPKLTPVPGAVARPLGPPAGAIAAGTTAETRPPRENGADAALAPAAVPAPAPSPTSEADPE